MKKCSDTPLIGSHVILTHSHHHSKVFRGRRRSYISKPSPNQLYIMPKIFSCRALGLTHRVSWLEDLGTSKNISFSGCILQGSRKWSALKEHKRNRPDWESLIVAATVKLECGPLTLIRNACECVGSCQR